MKMYLLAPTADSLKHLIQKQRCSLQRISVKCIYLRYIIVLSFYLSSFNFRHRNHYRMCMENGLGCKLVFSRQKISVYYTPKHPNKSVFVSFFHLLSTNTKIINKSQFYLGVNSTYISLYCLALVSHDTSLFISRITISSQLALFSK